MLVRDEALPILLPILQMRGAAPEQFVVGVAHGFRPAAAEHDLEIDRLQAIVLEPWITPAGHEMHSQGPSRVVTRRPVSSSTNTSRNPLRTKNTSSTSWVCAALPWPGSTYMIESVKLPAGITVGSPCLPEPPAPMKPSILASSNAAQSGLRSRKRPT
jgi:hypothetical protein